MYRLLLCLCLLLGPVFAQQAIDHQWISFQSPAGLAVYPGENNWTITDTLTPGNLIIVKAEHQPDYSPYMYLLQYQKEKGVKPEGSYADLLLKSEYLQAVNAEDGAVMDWHTTLNGMVFYKRLLVLQRGEQLFMFHFNCPQDRLTDVSSGWQTMLNSVRLK